MTEQPVDEVVEEVKDDLWDDFDPESVGEEDITEDHPYAGDDAVEGDLPDA